MMMSLRSLLSTVSVIWHDPTPDDDFLQNCHTKRRVALFLMLISIVLTALNIVNGWSFMTKMTGILVFGFAFAAYMAGRLHQPEGASAVMAVMVALIFSLFAVTGENEGFACLWILLVPILGIHLIGLRAGVFLSLYFQIFLVFLFYTPLRQNVTDSYTGTFLVRFPLLYFATFGATAILAFQKQFFIRKTQLQALTDGATKLNNRFAYMKYLNEIEKSLYLNVAIIDLNRLKNVNDTQGHEAGDEIICGVADCLKYAFGDSAFIARIGGDEFVVLSAQESQNVWNQQLDSFRNTAAEWRGTIVDRLSVAIGSATRTEHPGLNSSELVRLADEMMYRDKEAFYETNNLHRR